VSPKSKLGEMLYWWACGFGGLAVGAGVLAAYRQGSTEPVLVSGAFGIGAWLVGRALRDVLSR
jgi:hypothetical protein